MKTPKASGALRWAPDSMPSMLASLADSTPLCRQDQVDQSWAPLDQILDPLLVNYRQLLPKYNSSFSNCILLITSAASENQFPITNA